MNIDLREFNEHNAKKIAEKEKHRDLIWEAAFRKKQEEHATFGRLLSHEELNTAALNHKAACTPLENYRNNINDILGRTTHKPKKLDQE